MNSPTVLPQGIESATPAAELIKRFKECISQNYADLFARFAGGVPADDLIRERSEFLDQLLFTCWRHFLRDEAQRLALIAVGGYGRQELHPYSDIDLLILLEKDELSSARQMAALADFFNFLWDIGLKPAQSVRTVEECVNIARDDQTIITNLTESRLICGAEPLFARLCQNIGTDQIWPSAAFFTAKMAEQTARYLKYHDTAFNLEPNIKDGPGGLRDIQTIGWIIKRHYGSSSLLELVQQGWLTEAEFEELQQGQHFLWQVRFALHALTGRAEDRLLFDHQRQIARQFGYTSGDVNLSVEMFMQRYFRTVMALERLNDMVLQLFKEVVIHGDDDCVILPLNDHFQAVNRYVEALRPDVFEREPTALLQIFAILQQHPGLIGIRAATIRLIRRNLQRIDDDFRRSPEACRLFMDILRLPGGITHVLNRMNRYGVLAAYLPEFGRVVGRMQYDLFHVYTVDEHTLFVIRNLRRFSLESYRQENPLCNEIFELIDKPELLYIAGLMHDIAKGRGEDHSLAGADTARDFCQRHGIGEKDAELVQWLVKHHLLMSMTAQRKDIGDPDVIHEFATLVRDQHTLDHLYLLTVADIRATNPNLWNSWRDALLKELYVATRWALLRGLTQPVEQAERVAEVKANSRAHLNRLGIPERIVERVWGMLSDEYFLRYLSEEVVWHTVALGNFKADELPLILLRPLSQRGSAEIFIFARNQDFIFAHSTAVLDQLGLTIFDAKFVTARDGFVLNSYHVLEQSGEPIRDQLRQMQICTRVREALTRPGGEPIHVHRRETRQIRHFAVPTQIYFHDDPHQRYTTVELVATDRPGLLSKVGLAFLRCNTHLYNAKISTIGSRAEDIFFLTGSDHRPMASPAARRELTEAILELVGER